MQTSLVDIEKTVSLLKLLEDKTRLTMVKILDSHDCCVCEFVAIFKATQPAISQHVRKLNELYPMVVEILKHVSNQDHRLCELWLLKST